MVSSPRKKRLYLAVGLLAVMIFALLWHVGQYIQGSHGSRKESRRADAKTLAMQPTIVTKKISASVPGEAHAGEGDQPGVVRKKLPPMQPTIVTKKISASVPGEAHAGEGDQPGVVRKKLPPMPPAPAQKAEPPPAVAAPAPEPATVVEGVSQQPSMAGPVPADAAASPAPEAPKGLPEKPIVAEPPAPAPPPATAASPVAPAPSGVRPAPALSPRPVPPKIIAKATPSERGAYPFSLLLSSNRGKQNALTTLPDYRRKGLAPYLAYTDLGEKGKWWRTLYGYYPTLEDALEAKRTLNLIEAVVVKTPFANLVGEYRSEKEASEAAAQLSQKGLSPYTVKGSQNSTRLMAGAFPTRQEAEQQQRELEAQGITAQTIQR